MNDPINIDSNTCKHLTSLGEELLMAWSHAVQEEILRINPKTFAQLVPLREQARFGQLAGAGHRK